MLPLLHYISKYDWLYIAGLDYIPIDLLVYSCSNTTLNDCCDFSYF